jgi:hypothetical protein
MKRRHQYDDEMDEMDKVEEGEDCGCEDPDDCDCEEAEEEVTPRRSMKESRNARRTSGQRQLSESNALLAHANARSARYLIAYSGLVNSALNESQQMAVIERLHNAYDMSIKEWQEYVNTTIAAYERGDRRDSMFEWRGSEPRGTAKPLHESVHVASTPQATTGDTALDNTLMTMRRMQRRGNP